MTSEAELPNIGLLAGPSTGVERAFRKWEETIQHIHALGAQVVLLNQGVELDGGNAESAILLGESVEDSHLVSETNVNSIRDYTGKLAVTHNIPTLNSQSIIRLAQSKDRFSSLFPDLTARTLLITKDNMSDIVEFSFDLPGSEIILKPNVGLSGEDVTVSSKTLALENTKRLLDNHDGVLIQELLETSHMHAGIIGMTEEDSAKIHGPISTQELRFFNSNNVLIPVLKVGASRIMDGDSTYIYVDPESVPEQAYEIGHTVINGLLAQTGDHEVHGALDLVYQREEDSWKVMEMNVKEPGLPKRSENQVIADQVKKALAEQLVRMTTT
jgi:glutathione synthase/RimK-type ligase-like ATP-grasp enzyme